MKGLENLIHECERLLMELRGRVDPEAQQERARLQALRDKAVAQVQKALRDIGLPIDGNGDENGNGNAAGAAG